MSEVTWFVTHGAAFIIGFCIGYIVSSFVLNGYENDDDDRD